MITVFLKPGLFRPGFTSREDGSQFLVNNLYRINTKPHTWRPPTDIYEIEDRYIVLVEIAGMQESDFTVSLDHNILIISGFRNTPVDERRAFHQMEIPFGDFTAQIELPALVDIEDAEARYENGFLKVTLSKEKPRRIEIIKE